MEYYIEPDGDAETDFKRIESPENITAVDPACGSGHILVYAFDLIAAMYEEEGYSRRDIPRLILEKNLTGLESDPRAAAMASFALTMKACEYDLRFLRRGVKPRITVLSRIEFDEDERDAIARTMKDQERIDAPFLLEQVDLLDVLAHLDEAGSLLAPTEADLGSVRAVAETVMDEAGMFGMAAAEKAQRALEELEPLARHYDVVVGNPPYLGSGNMDVWLSKWTKENYPDEKNDLCTCFIARGLKLMEGNGYSAMLTASSWMFISSFEKMRGRLIDSVAITSMIQQSTHGFPGVTVPTTMFSLHKGDINSRGSYIRLEDFDRPQWQQPRAYEAIHNHDCGWFYRADQQDFKKIPGSPIAYWLPSDAVMLFASNSMLSTEIDARVGLITGNVNRFLKQWQEVSFNSIEFGLMPGDSNLRKWIPCTKGGNYRLWYGNNNFVVNWENDGWEMKNDNYDGSRCRAHNFNGTQAFKEGISWSTISSASFHCRYVPNGFMFDTAGPFCEVINLHNLNYILSLMSSSTYRSLINVINPTLNFPPGYLGSIPYVEPDEITRNTVDTLAPTNVSISRVDWDSYETSWDFDKLSLIRLHRSKGTLEQAYESWKTECNERFYQLKANEEELNRIFAEIYHMENEVPIEVPLDKVSVHIVFDSDDDVPEELKGSNYVRTKADEVKSLISYAVGCIMGRYSLDKSGLVLANQGDGLSEYLQQVPEPSFIPDADGIIPLTDIEYFHDDATGLFVDFMAVAFGEEHLEENLQFVADALGGTGTPRQVIRAYFRDGFFSDHCKAYSVQSAGKRPIYWLFDSGKKGGFRALFYMHRYTPDLLARLRTEYVLPQQDRYNTQIDAIDDAMATADRREAADLRKRRKKLADQLVETIAFDEKVHHLADQMIEIDLDDGVKHNYALFQDVLAKIK